MVSFRLGLTRHRKAAARFVADVRYQLQRALADTPEISQTDIAETIGVHRSVISRQLRGMQDLSISRVAEIADVLGFDIVFDLTKPAPALDVNHPLKPANIEQNITVQTGTTSRVVSSTPVTKEMATI